MTYPVVAALNQQWNSFEKVLKNILKSDDLHLPDIQKLMTAESVIDLSAHEIYSHARFVHDLTVTLIDLQKKHADDESIKECCQLWLELLKKRNQLPLKLQHHQRLDGECDFRFSLQLMEGKPCGLKEIQVLHHQKDENLDAVVKSMHRLGVLAHGHSFGGLPLMKNAVLTSLMEYKDTICLVARDQSDQVIGYCWGLMLRDVEISKNQKANIFWIMDLARDPDFFDEHAKVGEQLRARMAEEVKLLKDCDLVGYQHVLNHKFHMDIVSEIHGEDERLDVGQAEHAAKTTLQYSEDTGMFMRAHYIRLNDNNYPYPEYKVIKPAIMSAFWCASHSAKDFIVGGIAFMGQLKYQHVTHKLLDQPIDQRIVAPVSAEQQACDSDVLKQIILSDQWLQQGKSLFSPRHAPGTIGKLQNLVRGDAFDFQAVKSCVANRKKCVTRGVHATLLYNAIDVADSPTFVLNTLLKNNETPKDWVELITNHRDVALHHHAGKGKLVA